MLDDVVRVFLTNPYDVLHFLTPPKYATLFHQNKNLNSPLAKNLFIFCPRAHTHTHTRAQALEAERERVAAEKAAAIARAREEHAAEEKERQRERAKAQVCALLFCILTRFATGGFLFVASLAACIGLRV